jgi:glycerol-3-phosphate dehydrogenase
MFANSDHHDLLIIGGGVTGAALAYLATQTRPSLRVILIEAGDLASGTSSRSSGFLHGGLRYLAQGRVGLVRRLLEGRAELAALVPDLVRPAPFILPLGPLTPHRGWLLRAALRLYGALERCAPGGGGVVAPRSLDAASARRAEPLLGGVPLDGALTYGELTVDDAGLVRALAHAARAAGARVQTRVRCEGLLRDGRAVVGVAARDVLGGESFEIAARVVVDATGPWSGRWSGPRPGYGRAATRDARERDVLRLARGTHVVLSAAALPLTRTLVFFAPGDRRALFASPRGRQVVIGTTEVDHQRGPDDVRPTRAEVDYLLGALEATLPAARDARDAVVTAFAGVRALAAGRWSGGGTGALDRDYDLRWDEPGLLAVRGGKLTLALHGARCALAALTRARRELGLPPLTVPAAGALRGPLPTPGPAVSPAQSRRAA